MVGVVAVGNIVRFDDVRGYGFIASSNGGDDVFVHANDFGEQRHLVRPGLRVEYEVEQGDRGLKVATVRILDASSPSPVSAIVRQVGGDARSDAEGAGEDDGLCDVLAPHQFTAEVTEVLIRHVPSLTGAEISQVRDRLLELARLHGWIEG